MLPDLFLVADPEQGPKPELDHFLLGPKAGRSKGITHEIVINHDIGPHDVYLLSNPYTS
jgi:hypothetical protein